MNAIIVDDETKARKMLHAMLADLCPEVEVLAECDDLPNAVKAIKRLSPQLVFLDIEMPGHSGLEILEFFSEHEIDFTSSSPLLTTIMPSRRSSFLRLITC